MHKTATRNSISYYLLGYLMSSNNKIIVSYS